MNFLKEMILHPITQNSVIFDTETTSLVTGAGILEATVFNIGDRKATEFIISPNYTRVIPALQQDITKLATDPFDVYEKQDVSSWRDVIIRQTFDYMDVDVNTVADPGKATIENLRWQNKFLLDAIREGRFPQITGGSDAGRLANRAGIDYTTIQTDITELGNTHLRQAMSGKTVWIANAPFESRMLGAQFAANDVVFKDILETRNPLNPNPFYVTGKEVMAARAGASITGDWRKVWEAYKTHTPKAGETAVRDILDVVKATLSYGKSLGYIRSPISFHGIGIDTTSKLYAKAFGIKDLIGLQEAHRSLEDAAIHEMFVLNKAAEIADILQEVDNNTPKGREYVRQAKNNKGPLSKILNVFSMQNQLQPELQKKAMLQRLGRAYEDFAIQGFTEQFTGGYKLKTVSQLTPSDAIVETKLAIPQRQRFTEMGHFLDWLETQDHIKHFSLDPRIEHQKMIDSITGQTKIARLAASKRYIEKAVSEIDIDIGAVKPTQRYLKQQVVNLGVLKKIRAPRVSNRMIQGIMTAGLGLAALTMANEGTQDTRQSVLSYNYEQYLAQMEGMPEDGIAGSMRSQTTDFGSPYRGPIISSQVLLEQDLLEEREKWLNRQYNIRYFEGGVSSVGSLFHFQNGYTFLEGGQPVPLGYRGTTGHNMLSVNLDDGWKVTAEDADTIVMRKKGLISAMSSFFGMGNEISIRLAGLDSPELSHGGRTYRGAQPYAEEAKAILQEKLKAGDLELVYSPGDVSYGRMMGVIYSGDKNLNYELIKEGAATHLPYGKTEDAIVNYKKMKNIEDMAYAQNRGLWATAWGDAFYGITEKTRQRPTLNTLANKAKIAENASYIEMVSAMEQARELGKLPANWDSILTGINQHYDPFRDDVSPGYFNTTATAYTNSLHLMKMETAAMLKNSGSNPNKNPIARSRSKLNNYLAIDSLSTTNSPHTRHKLGFVDSYPAQAYNRQENQVQMQNQVMSNLFMSHIGHHRM